MLILIGIGATCGVIACNMFLDKIYIKLGKAGGGTAHPEYRLPFTIGGVAFLPAVVALYGWAPYAYWPVYLLLLAVGLLGFAIIIICVPLSSYIVDAFGLYSASAITIVLIARCLGGSLLPLVIPSIVDAIGFGYCFLALAALCLTLIPMPIVVMRYGLYWRQNSVYTRDISFI